MLSHENGIMSGSEFFDAAPFKLAQEMFLYVTMCGSFYCNTHYSVCRQQYNSMLLRCVKRGKMEIGISKFHFIRIFKKYMNVSPYEYLIQRKIITAQHLLKTTQLSVKEIAYQCGYESESGFIKAFVDKTGISPSEYRNIPL